jgi:ornithine cyclodeaminase/alanine dehydrogenase-like protein (mu-crystallin family)
MQIKTNQMDEITTIRDSIKVLDSSSIKSIVSMSRAIKLMEIAFPILSAKQAHVPARVVMRTPDHSMSVFFKPAFLEKYQRMSIKILTQIHGDCNPDNPTIKGLVMLIDMVSGDILSISDGRSITSIRTGAASGIATSYLANQDASSLAVFGCGAQGLTQVEAVLAVRPITRICLFDVSECQVNALAQKVERQFGISCEINPGLGVLRDMDVICTATPSKDPLFSAADLQPGVHINAVGSYRPDMNEIDPEIFRNSLIYLDDAPACIKESGDIIRPVEAGIIRESDIIGELGELISGTVDGRKNRDDITIFKTVGNAIQDFFIANEAYEKSIHLPDNQRIILND